VEECAGAVTICLDLAAQLGLLLLLCAISASAHHVVQYPPTGLLLSACLVHTVQVDFALLSLL
jgi:hypothetical protein